MLKDKLTQKLKKHDEKALEMVMDQYGKLVATIINNVSKGCLSKEDIEETVADVFITLWNNAENIQDGKLKGYICCIARTRGLNKVASCARKKVLNIEEYDFEDDFSIADEAEKNDVGQELREIITEIGQPDQEIIIRYYYYSQTVSKISSVMGIKLETVKSKLKRTRAKIKSKLTERGYAI